MKKITSFFGIKKKSSKSTNKAKKEESSGSTSPSITTHDVFFENNNTKEQTGGAPQRRSNGQHDAGIPIRSMGELGGIEEEKDEDLTDSAMNLNADEKLSSTDDHIKNIVRECDGEQRERSRTDSSSSSSTDSSSSGSSSGSSSSSGEESGHYDCDSKPDATDSGSPSSGTRTKDVKSPYNIPWTSEPLLEENEEEESTDEEDIFESETNRSEISVVTLTDGKVKRISSASRDSMEFDHDIIETPRQYRNRTQELHITPTRNSLNSSISPTRIQSESPASSTADSVDGSEQIEKPSDIVTEQEKWKADLNRMKDFLNLKSTEQQLEEGCTKPVDSATVEDVNGLPYLAFRFDVQGFQLKDVNVGVENDTLYLDGQAWEDATGHRIRKTLLRRVELPEHVDPRNTACVLTTGGVLEIFMPFHFNPQRVPAGPNIVPIMQDWQGRRHLRLVQYIGSEFTADDVKVVTREYKLIIEASYDADLGKYGELKSQRQIKNEYRLPAQLRDIDEVNTALLADGTLIVDVVLKKKEKLFSYQISSKTV